MCEREVGDSRNLGKRDILSQFAGHVFTSAMKNNGGQPAALKDSKGSVIFGRVFTTCNAKNAIAVST
jgi:hypothetical protein